MEELIKKLEDLGFKRWTKAGKDRMYVNASTLGLNCTYYNTGNISSATFKGEGISNCRARKLKAAKTYVDLINHMIVSDDSMLAEAVAEIIGVEPENSYDRQIKITF